MVIYVYSSNYVEVSFLLLKVLTAAMIVRWVLSANLGLQNPAKHLLRWGSTYSTLFPVALQILGPKPIYVGYGGVVTANKKDRHLAAPIRDLTECTFFRKGTVEMGRLGGHGPRPD